jgi:fructokinase
VPQQIESPLPVLVVGESLVDLVTMSGSRAAHPGGSPLNVAFGLGRLGVPTELLTEFADDDYGVLLSEHLATAAVSVIRQPDGRRRTSTAEVTVASDGAANYAFDLQWTLSPLSIVPPARIIHTGSIAAVMQPGAEAVVELFTMAAPEVVLTYDPNVRAEIMGERDAIRARVESVARKCTVVKLSDEDAYWLYPRLSSDEVCDHFVSLGVGLVAVTLGPQGCVLATREARVRHPAVRVDVVDTIGAGDSFMSALLFALATTRDVSPTTIAHLTTHELEAVATVALASAAITVSRASAMPPTLAELTAATAGVDPRPPATPPTTTVET